MSSSPLFHNSQENPNELILSYIMTQNLTYWLTSVITWIPWVFAPSLGMMTMLIMVPITIVPATLMLLRKTPPSKWRNEAVKISYTYVIMYIVIDLLFWVIWRGHDPLKWFLPSNSLGTANFIGYIEVAVTPIITERLAEKSEKLRESFKINLTRTKVALVGTGLFGITLISAILFW